MRWDRMRRSCRDRYFIGGIRVGNNCRPSRADLFRRGGGRQVARKQNPEILMAEKQMEAARGGVVEARAGFLPQIVSSGLIRKRERQSDTTLRPDDYDASRCAWSRAFIRAGPTQASSRSRA